MKSLLAFCRNWLNKAQVEEDEAMAFERPLRTFDIETIAPYDHKGVVAFLHADKLSDLTSDEIRIFLLLRDNPDPRGYTTRYIARWLDMSPRLARSCLSALDRKGYALASGVIRYNERGRSIKAWVCNREHWYADEDMLYWEFGRL